jgi:ATP-binding protein involved in chromosome partitioning
MSAHHGPPKAPVEGIQNIIAVSSGKGGVGKTTVAVNLAAALAARGLRVGLLDTDVYGPNVPLMVGLSEQPRIVGQKIVPLEGHGLKVMSMGFLNPGDKPVVWRGPMLHGVVKQFLSDVDWGELDFLVIDMPPGTGDVQLSLAQLVPVQGAIVVTTPQEVAAADVRKAINMFEQVGVPLIGVVENMSYFVCDSCDARHEIFGRGAGDALVEQFSTVLLGRIPMGAHVRESGDSGVPVVLGAPDSEQAAAFREIAEAVTQRVADTAGATALPIIKM